MKVKYFVQLDCGHEAETLDLVVDIGTKVLCCQCTTERLVIQIEGETFRRDKSALRETRGKRQS